MMRARLAGSTVIALALGWSALVASPVSAAPETAEATVSAPSAAVSGTVGQPRRSWKVSAGGAHTCAVRGDGSLWCWGSHGFGQLGLGDEPDPWVPTRVGTDDDWAKVSAGKSHTCAVRTDRSLWCWGSNYQDQL